MTQEEQVYNTSENPKSNGLTEAQNERFVVLLEASIHLHEALRNILENGLDAENKNKNSLMVALAYLIVASNLNYSNGDVDVDSLMPIVQGVHGALEKALKFQPKPEVAKIEVKDESLPDVVTQPAE